MATPPDGCPTCTSGVTSQSLERYTSPERLTGRGETQKIEVVPLDKELGLPQGDFSYVLQDWLQRMCVQNSYAESVEGLEALLGLSVSVRSAQAMNQAMADHAPQFQATQPAPDPSAQGELLVVTADGKGVVMRRDDESEKPTDPAPGKNGTKRMASVGAVYRIDPLVRTAGDVVDELRRQERQSDRPVPRGKRLGAPDQGERI